MSIRFSNQNEDDEFEDRVDYYYALTEEFLRPPSNPERWEGIVGWDPLPHGVFSS